MHSSCFAMYHELYSICMEVHGSAWKCLCSAGIRLCKAQKKRYKHLDLADLEAQLAATQSCRQRLIVTDGVFSMDGDVAPLREICDLADKYRALVFVDECHATGFLGATGRGTPEYCGVQARVDVRAPPLLRVVHGDVCSGRASVTVVVASIEMFVVGWGLGQLATR